MNANKLIIDCQKSLLKDEGRIRTIRGVRNLSRADLETAILYAQHVLNYGTWEGMLMPPRGGVEELLGKY